uniref:RRM domain-containing protein n=1 Tax=Kalanchoe fedtschenkoi TaxID=63787 RepID=A0A7N0U8V5_KALFE
MNSNLAVQEEEEHEVYGADIPLDDDPTDSVNSEMPKKEDKLKDLEMIRKRFEEIEQEAEMLRAKQVRIQKAMGLEKADETSALGPTLAEKEAVDARSIYIGNVDYECVPEELQEHFKSCGTINRVTIPVDELGMPKGFAYVEFDAPEAVQAALALTGTELHGRQIKVYIY